MGWLVAAPLFFILFFISRYEHTQTSTYQNTREHFKHIFEQSSQQSNRAVALSIQSAGSDQQMCIQALNRLIAYLDVYVCVCLVAFYLSLHCSRVSLRAHPLPFHNIQVHQAFSNGIFLPYHRQTIQLPPSIKRF